ncbi:hypothetical protein [Rummeliibacillus pycnus]|nr:hypothetical protein [Rummeliibacillus pycnus]
MTVFTLFKSDFILERDFSDVVLKTAVEPPFSKLVTADLEEGVK